MLFNIPKVSFYRLKVSIEVLLNHMYVHVSGRPIVLSGLSLTRHEGTNILLNLVYPINSLIKLFAIMTIINLIDNFANIHISDFLYWLLYFRVFH